MLPQMFDISTLDGFGSQLGIVFQGHVTLRDYGPERMTTPALPPGPAYILRGAGSPVTALHFTESLHTGLLSGTQDGKLHVWDLKTRRIRQTIEAHDGHHVLSIFTGPVSTDVVTLGREGCLKLWHPTESSYKTTGQIPASALGFCGAAALPQKGSSCLVALPDESSSQVKIFDLDTQKMVRKLIPDSNSGHSRLGMCMCMSAVTDSDGSSSQFLVGYENGSIVYWDIATGKMLDEMTPHTDAVTCMAYSASANKGLSGSVDDQLAAWCVTDQKLTSAGKVTATNPGFNCARIRSDDKIIVTGGWDNNVRVFGLKKLRPLAVLSYHKESVQCLAFSPDHLLAAGSKDSLISVWDIFQQS